MPTFHISQDDTGFWQLAFEDDDGTLTLVSHHFPEPEHLIEDARDLVTDGRAPNALIMIGPPRFDAPVPVDPSRPYVKPLPRRVVR
jgi:hypothetical protein